MEISREIQNFKGKSCFIITPLGADDSDIRKKAEAVIDELISPVVKDKFSMQITLPHKIAKTESINDQIIQHLLYDDLVIANLTGQNSNVMYELGIRHAAKKHVVKIAEEGTRLPFDITTERTIFYKHDLGGISKFKEQLIDAIEENLSQPERNINNPVYRVHDNKILKDFIGSTDTDVAGILKETNENVKQMLYSNDFADFTYKLSYEGIIYRGGRELLFFCQFKKTNEGQLEKEDLRVIENYLEGSPDLYDNKFGYKFTRINSGENVIECKIITDKPLYISSFNRDFEREQLSYEAILVSYDGLDITHRSG